MKIIKRVLVSGALLLWAFHGSGCTYNEMSAADSSSSYRRTEMPNTQDVLFVFDPATNAESNHVMIILQGGPRNYLSFEKDGRTLSRYLPDYQESHVVYLHQAQTYNDTLYTAGFDFSIEDAKRETDNTTAMLDGAIRHFKALNKEVTVIGHSYGAFVIHDYLASYTSSADTYIVSAGRLDVDIAMVEDNLKGLSSGYADDGNTYVPFIEKDFSEYSKFERGAYHVKALLKAAYGQPRYSRHLAAIDMGNVYYVSGKSDQQVGALTEAEVLFLRERGATVILVEGGHYDVYKRMIDNVMERKIIYNK